MVQVLADERLGCHRRLFNGRFYVHEPHARRSHQQGCLQEELLGDANRFHPRVRPGTFDGPGRRCARKISSSYVKGGKIFPQCGISPGAGARQIASIECYFGGQMTYPSSVASQKNLNVLIDGLCISPRHVSPREICNPTIQRHSPPARSQRTIRTWKSKAHAGDLSVLKADLDFARGPVLSKNLERLGEGRQAELFVWPSGGVLKLSSASRTSRWPNWKPASCTCWRRLGLPMPQILGTAVTVEHRPGVVMERLIGPDQLTLLGRKPWKVATLATALGRLHARLHSAVAPEGLRPLRPSIQIEIAASDSVPRDIKAQALADLNLLPDGAAICHWDFHPGNVIEAAGSPNIIDWSNALCGDRLADVARTLLILQGGTLAERRAISVAKVDGVRPNCAGAGVISANTAGTSHLSPTSWKLGTRASV